MTNLRIMHLRATNFYGGPERQLHFHAREASNSGYSITIASFSEAGALPQLLETVARDGINTHLFDVKSAYDSSAVSGVRKYLVDRQIDIFCTHDYRCNVIGYLAARKTRSRWVPFSRGWTQDDLKVRLYQIADRFVLRRAGHLVAVSEAQKERLRKARIRENRITVVPNAIDIGAFEAVEPVDLRARFGFDSDTILCVCGGRFSREKGQMYLVHAAARALESNPELRFILFGDGPDKEKIRTAILKTDYPEKIICPGFEKNVVACLKGADILINPSLSEGLPNIVLEAMAVRLPVVATAVGGVPEIVSDGQTGFLVPSQDSEALARVIVETAADCNSRARVATAAYEFIAREYTFTGQFRKLANLYDLVVQ